MTSFSYQSVLVYTVGKYSHCLTISKTDTAVWTGNERLYLNEERKRPPLGVHFMEKSIKRKFSKEKSSSLIGLVRNTNMTAVSLF